MADFLNAAELAEVATNGLIIKYEDFIIPEVNKVIRLRNMSGTTRVAWEQYTYEIKEVKGGKTVTSMRKDHDFRAGLIAFCACDENFRSTFTEDDIDKIADLPMEILAPLFTIACRLNGLYNQEEIIKNSGTDQKDNSSSG